MSHQLRWTACVAISAAVSMLASPAEPAAQSSASRPNAVLTRLPQLAFDIWPADFDEDGTTDLVAGHAEGGLVIVLGNGDGTFGPERRIGSGPLRPVVVGDFDGDRHADVLAWRPMASGSGHEILAIPGRGDGSFGAPAVVASQPAGSDVLAAQAADFDGDGHRDVAALETNRLLVYPGRGHFVFDAPVALVTDPFAWGVIAADLDGDRRTDLAVATEDLKTVNLFMNEGALAFSLSSLRLEHGALGITARDLNRDGAQDLVVSAGRRDLFLSNFVNGFVYVFPGNGDGTFGSPSVFETNAGPQTVVAGDFTGDGIQDIATGHLSGAVQCESRQHLWDSVSILRGLGDGRLGPAATVALGSSEGPPDDRWYRWMHHSLKTSDLDGDRWTDLIASPGAILLARPPAANRPPTADAGTGMHISSADVPYLLNGSASDPDHDWLRFTWTDESGKVLATVPRPCIFERYGTARSQTFTLRVEDGRGGIATDTVTFTFGPDAPQPGVLPESEDIGVVGAGGSASFDGSTYTVTGSGADIWGTADGFHYVHTAVTGNFEITARVLGVEHVHQWTKAGLMIREDATASSRHAFVFATPTAVKGVAFQRRVVGGAASVHTAGPAVAPPSWLRLRRTGDVVTAFHRRSDGEAWTLIGAQAFNELSRSVHVGLAVTSHADGQRATARFDRVSVDASPSWASDDVGSVGQPGSTDERAWPQFSMLASGTDIWGTADAFRFHHARWTGDGTVTVRVRAIQGAHAWTKAGVMFRESLDPRSRHVMVIVSPGKGVAMQYRRETGGASANTAIVPGTAPEWLRITRSGSSFVGYASEDGVTWQTLGSANVPMLAGAHAGAVLTSHDNTRLASAVFDGLELQHGAPVPPHAFAITAPVPDTRLRATSARFTWQGDGDAFWLDVGTTPGGSEVYASGPLGPVSEHTARNLPLDGTTLHVRLRRQMGGSIDSIDAKYTAAVRKGLLVVTDFADRQLEDWTGAGMNDVADISVQLRDMERHWAWLSRGLERFEWNIVRVRVPRPVGPAAYLWWGEFRDEAIGLARQQVQTADYDVDSDGIIDTSWLIVSSGDVSTGSWAIGGASRNAGANVFVDGQASASVIAGATGNFNHEVGHNVGLPDMYGTYGSLDTLTLMSFSWPVPPPDFAAYERLKLGWLQPQVLTETTRGAWLPPANDVLAAVMVPTGDEREYF